MSTSDEPLISVLTPVYNGEKYLTECIESVLAQTYQNWEYIIVDNCSTDRSSEIIKNFARKEKRISYFKNENFVSVMENHHMAFKKISPNSKYCKVIHADDWLYPECIEKMTAIGEANPRIGIVGSYRLDGVWVNLDGLQYPSHVTSGVDICRKCFLDRVYVFGSPSSLLIRSDIIRNRDPFYDEANYELQADVAACYEILKNWDFGFVHQVLTYTRRHKETQTARIQKYTTYNLTNLKMLKRYGMFYLTENEYQGLYEKEINTNYRYLGKSYFQKGGKQMRQVIKNELKKIEGKIDKRRLWMKLFLEIIDILTNQKRLAAGFIRRFGT